MCKLLVLTEINLENIFKLRSSESFTSLWKGFLTNARVIPTPTLYQHLVTLIFREQVEKNIATACASSDSILPLSDNDRNALRYIAGFVCRHLRKQLERGSHEQKEELILCLMDLTAEKDPESLMH